MADPAAGFTPSPSVTGSAAAAATGNINDNLIKFEHAAAAWVKLVFGIVYMGFGFFCLVTFFQAREVFEIRARSVYLVTTLGLLLILYQGIIVDLHAIILFDTRVHFLTNNLLVFFVTFSISSCYISRVIRLAVGFSPQLRRSMPKLMSDKLLAGVSVAIGVVSLAIPLYYRFTMPVDIEYRDHQREAIWICTVALQILLFCLLPVVWFIDDLFHISRELMVIIMLGLIQSVLQRLYLDDQLGDNVQAFINPPNMQLVAISVLFGLSIVDPVRRLTFSPMAKSSSVMARAAARNSAAKARKGNSRGESNSGQQRQGSRVMEDSGSSSQHMWNYDNIAINAPMAEAFRAFANRALCQESVWFLEEVARFQNEDFTIASPLGGGKVEAFEAITKRFIADGAPDEVNLSYKDKKKILNKYNMGFDSFEPNDDELSGVFDRAYSEIRFMIEANILHKFTETDEFRKAANSLPSETNKRRFFFMRC